MSDTSTTFEYTDPRQLDGDPFQVASAAGGQALTALEVSAKGVDDLYVMSRGAHMERQLQRGEEPDGVGFATEPLGKRITSAQELLAGLIVTIRGLTRAASYNPRKPPKELE